MRSDFIDLWRRMLLRRTRIFAHNDYSLYCARAAGAAFILNAWPMAGRYDEPLYLPFFIAFRFGVPLRLSD